MLTSMKDVHALKLSSFNAHTFRHLGIIECRLQVHNVGDVSFGKLAHVRPVPYRSTNGKSFGHPALIQPLIVGMYAKFKVIYTLSTYYGEQGVVMVNIPWNWPVAYWPLSRRQRQRSWTNR